MRTKTIKTKRGKVTLSDVIASRSLFNYTMKRLDDLYKYMSSREKQEELKKYIEKKKGRRRGRPSFLFKS